MYGVSIMARKKQVLGMTDNQPGADVAKSALAKNNLDSLPEKLKRDLESTGGDLRSYLHDTFGFTPEKKEVLWKLSSGATAKFLEISLTYEQVKDSTYVDFSINGRDQEYLNKVNLEDLSTMDFQQFYPAIANRKKGKISFLDGSRRRAYFLSQEGKIPFFSVLISDNDISLVDAQALAKSIQTAKEHNLYELGKRCLSMRNNAGLTQQDIADAFSISQSRVSKAMKAAMTSKELYELFDDINELSGSDYAELSKVDINVLSENDKSSLLKDIKKGNVDIVMPQLRKLLKDHKPIPKKAIVSYMAEYEDKKKFAKKSVNKSTRKTTYEFQRLSSSEQAMIDEAIIAVFNKMEGD